MIVRKVVKHPHAGKVGPTRDFVERVGSMREHGSRRYSDVLDDFLELSFCALAKTTWGESSERAAALEARYMALVAKREPEYVRAMAELLAIAQVGVSERCDFLGVISGELGALSEQDVHFSD